GAPPGGPGRLGELWPAERNDHVGHARRHNLLSRLEAVRDALRAQASLLQGPILELHSDVVVGHAVEPERLHLEDHRDLLAYHRRHPTPAAPGALRTSSSSSFQKDTWMRTCPGSRIASSTRGCRRTPRRIRWEPAHA